jgi:hypothetical protein
MLAFKRLAFSQAFPLSTFSRSPSSESYFSLRSTSIMKSLALIAVLAGGLAKAHYVFSEFAVNGQRVGKEYTYIRHNTNSYQPTFPTSLNSPSMRCNAGADRGGSTQTLTVAAGSKINFPKVITHPGPVFIW